MICCNSGLQGPRFLVVNPVRVNEPRVDDHNTKVSPLTLHGNCSMTTIATIFSLKYQTAKHNSKLECPENFKSY